VVAGYLKIVESSGQSLMKANEDNEDQFCGDAGD